MGNRQTNLLSDIVVEIVPMLSAFEIEMRVKYLDNPSVILYKMNTSSNSGNFVTGFYMVSYTCRIFAVSIHDKDRNNNECVVNYYRLVDGIKNGTEKYSDYRIELLHQAFGKNLKYNHFALPDLEMIGHIEDDHVSIYSTSLMLTHPLPQVLFRIKCQGKMLILNGGLASIDEDCRLSLYDFKKRCWRLIVDVNNVLGLRDNKDVHLRSAYKPIGLIDKTRLVLYNDLVNCLTLSDKRLRILYEQFLEYYKGLQQLKVTRHQYYQPGQQPVQQEQIEYKQLEVEQLYQKLTTNQRPDGISYRIVNLDDLTDCRNIDLITLANPGQCSQFGFIQRNRVNQAVSILNKECNKFVRLPQYLSTLVDNCLIVPPSPAVKQNLLVRLSNLTKLNTDICKCIYDYIFIKVVM